MRNKNGGTLTVMAGLPGSGKSTYARKLNGVILSSDELRDRIGDVPDKQLFSILHAQIKDHLLRGEAVIYDATNLRPAKRRRIVDEFGSVASGLYLLFINTPASTCIARNAARPPKTRVPDSVMLEMAAGLTMPTDDEGWDGIAII